MKLISLKGKKTFALITSLCICFLITTPAFAAFNGILPVANLEISPTAVQITLSNYALTDGQIATATFTFPAPPIAFTLSDVTASNGTLSGLATTTDPTVYTATFTPAAGIIAPTNTITVVPKVTITTSTGTGSSPYSIAFDGTNMWTANLDDGSVSKITPTGTVTTYTGTGSHPIGIAFDGTNMWTVNVGDNSVSKITPTGTITTYTGTGSGPDGIAFDGTNMWTANRDNSVSTIGFAQAGASANYSLTPSVSHRGGGHAFIVEPATVNGSVLDFTINDGKYYAKKALLTLTFNADPLTVKGYAVSLDPTFANTGIQPYSGGTIGTFQLPDMPGIYTVYLAYFSTTGTSSSVIAHTISYQKNAFTRTLSFGAKGSDVVLLQKLLVQDGELVLPVGGTYGRFGNLTQAALGVFQVKYKIAKPDSQGYGVFGPKTQAEANKMLLGK